jgi:hypothetical protein
MTRTANGHPEGGQTVRALSAGRGAAVLSAGDAEQAKHVVYWHMKPVVGRGGSMTYTVADGGRVTDRADHIKVDQDTIAATLLAVTG